MWGKRDSWDKTEIGTRRKLCPLWDKQDKSETYDDYLTYHISGNQG